MDSRLLLFICTHSRIPVPAHDGALAFANEEQRELSPLPSAHACLQLGGEPARHPRRYYNARTSCSLLQSVARSSMASLQPMICIFDAQEITINTIILIERPSVNNIRDIQFRLLQRLQHRHGSHNPPTDCEGCCMQCLRQWFKFSQLSHIPSHPRHQLHTTPLRLVTLHETQKTQQAQQIQQVLADSADIS